MALSVRSILALNDRFTQWALNGNQVIAAVHNPLVIEHSPVVLSLEHREWMSGADFIKTQYTPMDAEMDMLCDQEDYLNDEGGRPDLNGYDGFKPPRPDEESIWRGV